MRFDAGLDPLLGSPTKLRLLRALLRAPDRRWTGRELAGAARVSTAQAARDLADFLDVGVVLRDVQGKSYAWRVNERHVLGAELTRIFDFEAHLRDQLVREVSELLSHTPVQRAILFGSVARGDERADSDVDLFLQVNTSREQGAVESVLEKVRERVWDRYGNPVSPLVYTAAQARDPPNQALLDTILREGLPMRAEKAEGHGTD